MFKKYLKSFLIALGVFLVLFVISDAAYFSYQIGRLFKGKTSVTVSKGQNPVVENLPANHIVIKDLDISAPIIYVNKKDDAVYEDALQQGVVHFPGTSLPGQLGNCYIFGHSSDYIWRHGDYKTVFAALTQIKVGDTIRISNSADEIFNYIVKNTFVTGPDDLSVLDQQENKKYLLTLQTSYPLGTALKRFIVQAEMEIKN
jgi:LPXTG-site transpeptidase (sortase) family protein